jgi:hypothetical protein
MEKAHVDFNHYKIVLGDDVLSRLGSRYFPKAEAGKGLRAWVLRNVGSPRYKMAMDFEKDLIISANEVYPEAAMADPVADLEVWDEWRTGLRSFPYEGVYTRLNIFHQENKTSATSSVGVLGEILAGRFAQEYVAPIVSVRPIRRWPDFIFEGSDGRYSFVESKASASVDNPAAPGVENIRAELLGEGLADAVQELNAEPFLRVWLVFTDVKSIQPLQMNVNVVEIEAPEFRRNGRKNRVPDAVINGLTQRLIASAVAEVEPEFEELNGKLSSEEEKRVRKELWKRIKASAAGRTENVLEIAVPADLRQAAADEIRIKIDNVKERKINPLGREGKRLAMAKKAASIGELGVLRHTYGKDQGLMLSELPKSELKHLRETWKPDWERANKPWGHMENLPLWRCSSAVLAIGELRHKGRKIETARKYERPDSDER